MSIERRLHIMLIITICFGLVSSCAIYQLAKSAKFHQLNSLHLKFVSELTDVVVTAAQNHPETEVVSRIINNIKDQPVGCLVLVNTVDVMIMKLIGTSRAIQLCEQDIILADQTLAKLDKYPKDKIEDEEIYHYLEHVAGDFKQNSQEFEMLVSNTVNFIIKATFWIILPFAIAMVFLSITIFKSVASNAMEYKDTAEALAESEIRNRELAYYDNLTGLPNRNLLSDRLNNAINTAKRDNLPFALFFIDLDRFKHVNDTLGHSAGDELITMASKRLQLNLRASDTLARFGGDEFVLVLQNLRSQLDAATVADKLIQSIAKPFNIDGVETYVTASIGIALYPDNGQDLSTLLKRADIAMYEAKAKGKNQFHFFNNKINEIADRRLLLERDLRHGLDQNELVLHYQPVIDLKQGNIVGTEALLRWEHPKEGMVSPVDFIPIAEDTGLIVDIGYWILEQVCLQNRIWQKEYDTNYHIAVNVSARQLRENNFAKTIVDVLDKHSLSANALNIEITESVFYSNDEQCVRTINELSEIGVHLLLDDFGTGYSSLSTLQHLPFNVIKIDRTFMQSNNKRHRIIAETIIDMASNFGMEIIAEGVENEQTARFLLERGCQYAQGYLFQRPLPVEKLDLSVNYVKNIQPLRMIETASIS